MAKQRIKKDIHEAREAVSEIMKEGLKMMADLEIDQIIKRAKKLTPSTRQNAIKDLSNSGFSIYKDALLTSMAVVVGEALKQARSEVPKKAKVELSEWREESLILAGDFDKLPSSVKKRLKGQVDLLTQTQKNDLDKAIMLQFSSSVESTDDLDVLKYDLIEASNKYISGPAIPAGASVVTARGINEARSAFFFDKEVLEEIDAFEFKNDSPETPICEDLNGIVFSKDDPNFWRYNPPLHFNCDSYIIPILKGNLKKDDEIEKLQPSSADLEKWIQFHDGKCCSGKVFLLNIEN